MVFLVFFVFMQFFLVFFCFFLFYAGFFGFLRLGSLFSAPAPENQKNLHKTKVFDWIFWFYAGFFGFLRLRPRKESPGVHIEGLYSAQVCLATVDSFFEIVCSNACSSRGSSFVGTPLTCDS